MSDYSCDRCKKTDETIAVKCYLGCTHIQCPGCARQTQQERDDVRFPPEDGAR